MMVILRPDWEKFSADYEGPGVCPTYIVAGDGHTCVRKSNGGLYGYPAVLLLCCIIDPLGNYGGYAKNTLRGARFIVPDLTESSILKTGIVIFLRTKLSSCLERNSPTIP